MKWCRVLYVSQHSTRHEQYSGLTLSTQGKIFSRWHFEIFFFFFPEKQDLIFHANCPLETICMKCQILFHGKNKKYIINLLSAELAQRVVKVNVTKMICTSGFWKIVLEVKKIIIHVTLTLGKQVPLSVWSVHYVIRMHRLICVFALFLWYVLWFH